MICLAVDTSSKFLCIVLIKNGQVLTSFNQNKPRAHGQLLIPEIKKILKKQKIKLQDLDCLAVNIGPGSFTGLRIGIAAIKGLSFALNIPIISLSSLDLIAYNCLDAKKTICSIVDAKRKQVYAAIFKPSGKILKRKGKYFLGPIDDLMKNLNSEIIFNGDGLGLYKEQIMAYNNSKYSFAKESLWYTQPVVFARLCYQEYENKNFIKAQDLSPLYLYSTTCTVRKKQKKNDK